ncbi:MAG: DegT/DnrJ/EryC1/StrS family aminotransferase [Proteobacteria bacterium]|nr:DegT/DnrJ/EryC1/StrS family aminotransferase [Pseudomonadota bacterium]
MSTVNWPSWPHFGEDESKAVQRVISSNQLFADREVRIFEHHFAEYVGVDFALGLGNATQGLHLALAALGVGSGDEVIVTPYSWISSASCVLMQNAIPIFCDIETKSLGLCIADVERKISKRTKAIILVHMFGYPARVADFVALAELHGISLIEDASHAHGAMVAGRKTGSFGAISVFSLHQRKAISVGDGGVLCTNNPLIYEKVRRLRSFGHEELSYNYRMTEFAGALGQVGLYKLDGHNAVRKVNAQSLAELLDESENFGVRLENPGESSVYYAVLIDVVAEIKNFDQKLENLIRLGIPVRKTWGLLHLHPHFNPAGTPARGLPWLASDYDGGMKGLRYSNVPLPVATHHCPNRLLELYVHPPAGLAEMEFAAASLKSITRD